VVSRSSRVPRAGRTVVSVKVPGPVHGRLSAVAKKHGVDLGLLLEEWAERAAIREYLGEIPRAEAERLAVVDACEALGLSIQENT
jgi:hypothetical protein